jgi:hypothetical protein
MAVLTLCLVFFAGEVVLVLFQPVAGSLCIPMGVKDD